MATQLDPTQRALNFSAFTRQFRQVKPSITKAPGEKFSIDIDKVDLVSKVRLLCTATLTAVHAANTSYTPADQAPYPLLESVKVSANLAYTPWETSGLGASQLMRFRNAPGYLDPVIPAAKDPANANKRVWTYLGTEAAAGGGAVNQIFTMYDLPLSVNDRDPVGLVMAQNQQTTIKIEGRICTVDDIAPAAAGYTFTLSNVTITPVIETFTIPPGDENVPDTSVVKVVQEQTDTTTAGDYRFKLPIGPTYRRIAWRLTTAAGAVVDDADLTGDVELILNRDTKPLILPGAVLQRLYQEQTNGGVLPRGMWGFDFTTQGLMNYGGVRDLLDTDGMTQVEIRIRHAQALNITVVYEGLEVMK